MSENLQILLLSGHILLGICLISIILIQRSKGSDMGAAFGGGASDTVFGARGSATFLSRTTAILATLFFITSLALAHVYRSGGTEADSVFDSDGAVEETIAPATDPVAPGIDDLAIEPAVSTTDVDGVTVTSNDPDIGVTVEPVQAPEQEENTDSDGEPEGG